MTSPRLFLSILSAATIAWPAALLAAQQPKGGGSTPPPNPEIAFVDTHLKVMNADGSNVRTVLSARRGDLLRRPCWSPDGAQLAHYGYVGGVEGVWVVDLDGTGARILARHGGRLPSQPDWAAVPTPDGRSKIVFAAYDASGTGRDVYVVNADGTGLQNLTNSPSVAESEAAWTRDGTGLLVRRYPELVLLHLAAAAPPATGLVVIGETVLLADWYAASPRSSNVFDLVAFCGTGPLQAPTAMRAYVLDLLATPWTPRLLTGGGSEETSASFSPDDTHVAFRRSGTLKGIYTIRLDGTGERLIHSRGLDPAWRRR